MRSSAARIDPPTRETTPLLALPIDSDAEADQDDLELLDIPNKTTPKRDLGAVQLMTMVYFIVVGGPFGIESAVGAAGPLLTMIGSVLVVLLWALPQALMGAELALMMNVNGGPVVWVSRAMGPVVGFINAYSILFSSIASLAMLIVLFIEYIPTAFLFWEGVLIRLALCIIITAINVIGVGWLSRLSLLMLLLVFSPFIAGLGLDILERASEAKNVASLLQVPAWSAIDWSLFISTTVWANDRIDSIGGLAGEVKGGARTFLLGVIGAFPLILVNYLVPVAIFYLPLPISSLWTSKYFVTIAYKFNTWLGHWMLFASSVSLFGQVSTGMAPTARAVWAMTHEDDDSPQFLPSFVGFSTISKSGTQRPVAAVVATGLLVFATSLVPFSFLVQVYLVVRFVNLFLEYAALIYLRFSEPDALRPWRVPGGIMGALFLPVPTLFLSAFSLYTSPLPVIITGAIASSVIFIGAAIFGLYHFE